SSSETSFTVAIAPPLTPCRLCRRRSRQRASNSMLLRSGDFTPMSADNSSVVDRFALRLLEMEAIRFGEFRLKSGRLSPVYVDLRVLASYPDALRDAGQLLAGALRAIPLDRISGIPYAGLPLGVAASLAGDFPLCYARKEAKDYGTQQLIEGKHAPG